MHELLKQLRSRRDQAVEARKTIIDAATSETRDLTDEESAKVAEAREQIAALDERIFQLVEDIENEARAADAAKRVSGDKPVVAVGNEPLTYRKGGTHSYFRDLAKAQPQAGGDLDARSRLQRHAQEMNVELRVNPNRTDGQGGEFVPPLWLIDQYVTLARAGRVAADLCRRFPLPAGTDTINLPTISGGTAAAVQTEAATVQNTDMTTSSVAGAVVTIAGQQKVSMQLIDQSPVNFDEVVVADLLADLAKQLDNRVINGTATNGKGITQVSSIKTATYTDATPTVPEAFPKIADIYQQIASARFLPAQAILMHPRRWGWFLAALDSSNRPLVVPSPQGPTNAFAGMTDVRAQGSVGTLLGLPVYTDANVTTTNGAGTNEDQIIMARFDDLYLYEGDIRSRVLFETDADTLQVRLQVWEYTAQIFARYPAAIGVVSGTGLITPTF